MKPSTSFTPAQNVAVLLVGDPGSGKSNLIMATPTPGIIDCDGNLGSAVRRAEGKKFFYSQPFRDDAGVEVPENLRWKRAMSETMAMLKHPEIETIVIDGLSNLCRWGMIHVEQELTNAGINTKKEYLAKYQSFIPLLSNFITTLRIPGKLVFVTVHQIADKDEILGRTRFFLDIPGRLSEVLGGQFTDVWGTESLPDPTNTKTMAKYNIRTKPTGYHVNLKASLDLEPAINVTDKTPTQIWSILAPKLSANQPKVATTSTVTP